MRNLGSKVEINIVKMSDFIQELDEQEVGQGDELFVHFSLIVDKGQAPVRIDLFLMDRITKITRNKLQSVIKAGNVLVNDKVIKANYKVRPLDNIQIVLPEPPEEHSVEPENIPLNIVYEDDDVMVINKPAGLVVHPGLGNRNGTLVNALAFYFKFELPIKEGNIADRPGLVHRIDKDTTGLMVIAKTEYAMSHLAKQFFDHTVQREYTALIWGEMEPPDGRIKGNLARNPSNRMQMTVFPEGNIGKEAITNYNTFESFYYTSLVNCRLETGRTHQIRAHLTYHGHPLFSDARYGGDVIRKGTIYTKYRQFVDNCFKICPRQALHARTLGFVHPVSGKNMFFECPIPEDFQQLVDKWRNYIQSRKNLDMES